jgi:FkbM family methyltransferase
MSLFGRQMYIHLFGKKIYYDINTDIGQKLNRVGGFERAEFEILKKIIKEDDVCFDIGANIGIYSVFFSQTAKNGRVFSFEPSKNTYKILLGNIGTLSNILPVNMATSDKNGISTFYNTTDNAYSGIKKTGKKPVVGKEDVLTIKIDDFIKQQNINKIDFVKIDVEGFEDETILGAIETLAKYKPILMVEICEGKNDNPDPQKTINRFLELGYFVYVVSGWKIIPFTKLNKDNYNYVFTPKPLNIS